MNRGRGDIERGSVTVFTVVVMSFAGILALVAVDLMRALESKATAQTAADAAALAAAQEMARPSNASPEELARDYADTNGAVVVECRCPLGGTEAVVTVRVPVSLLFLGGGQSVGATAKAVVEQGSRV